MHGLSFHSFPSLLPLFPSSLPSFLPSFFPSLISSFLFFLHSLLLPSFILILFERLPPPACTLHLACTLPPSGLPIDPENNPLPHGQHPGTSSPYQPPQPSQHSHHKGQHKRPAAQILKPHSYVSDAPVVQAERLRQSGPRALQGRLEGELLLLVL